MAKRIGISGLLLFLLVNPCPAADSTLRVVTLRIAHDREFEQNGSLFKVRRWVEHASKEYEARFGIRFEITEFAHWDSDDRRQSLLGLLSDLRQKIPKAGVDVVLGLTAQDFKDRETRLGTASYQTCYILMSLPRSESLAWKVLAHEMAHLFGAADIDEPGCIMHRGGLGENFNPFSCAVIALHKDRSFAPFEYPLAEDKWERTIALYAARKTLDKNEIDLSPHLCSLYLEKKDYSAIEEECGRIIDLYPQCPELFNFLGIAHSNLGKFDSARQLFESALELDPCCPEIHNNLGINYLRTGRWDDAGRQFVDSIALCPRFAEAYGNLGYVYLQENRLDRAAEECRKALALSPNQAEVLATLGHALVLLDDLEEAETISKRALALRPGLVGPHNNLSLIYMKRGLYSETVRLCERALELDPQNRIALNRMGNALHHQGSYEKAVEVFHRLIRSAPDFMSAYLNLSAVYITASRFQQAVEIAEEALARDPHHADILANMAQAHFKLGDAAQAEKSCLRSLRLDPQNAAAHNLYGIILQSNGDRQRAEAEFLAAAALDSDWANPFLNLGHLYFEQRNFPLSKHYYYKVIALNPDQGMAHNNLAVILFHEGDYQAAWEKVRQAEESGFPVSGDFKSALKTKLKRIP